MGMLSDVARPVVVCGPGRTKQSFRDQVNINKIIERHHKTGMLSHVNGATPFYGDVSGLTSYQDSLNIVKRANELFDGMSSAVRNKFENDPMQMIAFLNDDKNYEEAVKLGMVVPRKEPKAPVVDLSEKAVKSLKEASSHKGGHRTPKDED